MTQSLQSGQAVDQEQPRQTADGRRILVVEDDQDICRLLELHLRDNAYQVDVVTNGVDGLNRASNHAYQLIVLDLMLPGLDGLELCRKLRSQSIMIPILMLTARSSELDRVLGLELALDERIEIQSLVIDATRRSVTIDAQAVELTAREFDLLLHFARHPGRVFSRGQLLDQVWGYSHTGYEHTVNSHINRLRKKIEEVSGQAQYIETVWGVGYRFREV
jgi:DNA-binding response OmpR family regulator